ncbi:uncharacterized protein LOC143358327 [Halictus rubicundus]|uniref:uncharacterized protein LOC143358327 n=1 Tax=Halictus rubicundus TaxID=77578 RepID=UPI00403662B2
MLLRTRSQISIDNDGRADRTSHASHFHRIVPCRATTCCFCSIVTYCTRRANPGWWKRVEKPSRRSVRPREVPSDRRYRHASFASFVCPLFLNRNPEPERRVAMNDRRTIVAFAVAIAIALSCPNGSPTGCAAITVPIREILNTAISIPTAGIRSDTRSDNPVGQTVLSAVNVARSFLTNAQDRFVRWVNRVLLILSAFESPFLNSSNADNATNTADGSSNDNDTGGGDRRRRSTTDGSDSWIDQLQQSVASVEDQLTDLSLDLGEAPKLIADLAASIPNAIAHPLASASSLVSSAEGLSLNAVQLAAQNSFNMFWKLLTTQGLPWLRTLLDELDRTKRLPQSVHGFVKNFDAAYDFAKMLGYVQ